MSASDANRNGRPRLAVLTGAAPRAPLLSVAFLAMVVVIAVLPFAGVPEYSVVRHTASELGGQGAPHGWLMNGAFVAVGVAAIIDAWRCLPRRLWFHRVTLVLFGIGLVGAAVFHHAPVSADVPVDTGEDRWHSNLSGLVGASFVAFAVGTAFGGLVRPRMRWQGPAVGAFAIVMSAMQFVLPGAAGIWQRLLFLVGIGWLIAFLYRLSGAASGAGAADSS